MGFPICRKENERRRVLIPGDIKRIENKEQLFFENNYGKILGYTNEDYREAGCNIASYNEVLEKDIICDPKIGDAEYIKDLKENQMIFGWVHAAANKNLTNQLVNKKLNCYAWEDMYKKGRHVFWRNNEIAGEAAIIHAFECYGIMPYNTRVAVLGRGNVAKGAIKILTLLGAEVVSYGRKTVKLLQEELGQYDVIVNAIFWDTSRTDHIIYKRDLPRMKRNAMIIDVSCDKSGAVETSMPTTIEKPAYYVEGVLHYVVDHTPSIFYKTATMEISKQAKNYIDELVSNKIESPELKMANCSSRGVIFDEKILNFQKRSDLNSIYC